MKISCFFPMYNEEGNIERVVCSAIAVLSKRVKDFEVIIVDDGSSDRTAEIAQKLMQHDSRIRLVRHDQNLGYGAALRSGFAACHYDTIFQCDGDNQYNLEEIDKLLPFVPDYDFVIGYRIKRRDPFYRSLEALWYRFLLWAMFGLKLKDANCAFKFFKKSVIKKLDLKTNSAVINGEIFVKAQRLGHSRIKEIGVHHYPRKKGMQTGSKPGVLWEAWIAILGLWLTVRK